MPLDSVFNTFDQESETGDFFVTEAVKKAFDENGYILVKDLFTEPEINKLKVHMEQSRVIHKNAFNRSDGNDR